MTMKPQLTRGLGAPVAPTVPTSAAALPRQDIPSMPPQAPMPMSGIAAPRSPQSPQAPQGASQIALKVNRLPTITRISSSCFSSSSNCTTKRSTESQLGNFHKKILVLMLIKFVIF